MCFENAYADNDQDDDDSWYLWWEHCKSLVLVSLVGVWCETFTLRSAFIYRVVNKAHS